MALIGTGAQLRDRIVGNKREQREDLLADDLVTSRLELSEAASMTSARERTVTLRPEGHRRSVLEPGPGPATLWTMAATTKIDFDSELLAKLRARRPGKDDRTLLEELARIELGFETLREVQDRNALSDEEANDLAVRAVREVRAERR
ncbi:MAG TPA: hypothetical protein VGM91_22185 [Conexibacter sp.]